MEKIPVWQAASLSGIVAWIFLASIFDLTRKIRSFVQPWVAHHVKIGIPFILQIQVFKILLIFVDIYVAECFL